MRGTTRCLPLGTGAGEEPSPRGDESLSKKQYIVESWNGPATIRGPPAANVSRDGEDAFT